MWTTRDSSHLPSSLRYDSCAFIWSEWQSTDLPDLTHVMSMMFTLLRRSVMSLPCFLPLAPLSLTGPADAVRGCLPFSHAFFGPLLSPDADGGWMMAILLSAAACCVLEQVGLQLF